MFYEGVLYDKNHIEAPFFVTMLRRRNSNLYFIIDPITSKIEVIFLSKFVLSFLKNFVLLPLNI